MAMNRDERITRGAGLPPEIHEFGGTRAIYPSDGNGGSWFATNEYGITLALLNWNDVAPHGTAVAEARSRGPVIPTVIDSRSPSDLHEALRVSNFRGMMPFRLVGVFPSEQEILEWRWDSAQLDIHVHTWESRHWFSSSISDERAENLRGEACRAAYHQSDAGSLHWLRRLHASHAGRPGPFSLCAHRRDVKTLSYSEVKVTAGHSEMDHFCGSPCEVVAIDAMEIRRSHHVRSSVLHLGDPLPSIHSEASSPEQNNHPARYDRYAADPNRPRRKSVKEDEIGDLEHNEQHRDVQSRDVGELDRGQVERRAVESEQDAPGEKEADPRVQRGMMQCDSYRSVTHCFENSSRKHEQEDLHA